MNAVVDIKAIPTEYAGLVLRSRTEARWAFFFDLIRLKWEYEKEAFNLGELGSYLPDFWFPTVKMWAEVKPKEFTPLELRKARRLAETTEASCILLDGTPDARNYWTIGPYEEDPALGPPMIDVVLGSDHLGAGGFYSCTGAGTWEIERYDHIAELRDACQIVKFARFGEGEDPWQLVPQRFRRPWEVDPSRTMAYSR